MNAQAEMKRTTQSFKAEVNQLLGLLINSVYSNKEVFLRELISNASDAIDKYKYLSLTDREIGEGDQELFISLDIDKVNGVLAISDNGIGMTYDDVVENLGTIAHSGSKKFRELVKSGKDGVAGVNLIGQFGIGFYSSFIVADQVTVETRHAKAEKGVRWVSTGEGEFEIEEIELMEHGTCVMLKLRDGNRAKEESDEDFLNQYTVQKHVQKHCNFIKYPIRMNFYTEESERDADGKIVEGKMNTVVTEKTLNSIIPIWEKDRSGLKKEDYNVFYKQQFGDYAGPAEVLHFKGEGFVEFSSLLFIPSKAPYDLYTGGDQKGIQLYNRNVLILEKCEDLLPEAFKFVRGIVDTADLSLNVSRELLQNDRQLKAIRGFIEKKILVALKTILKKDRKVYEELWGQFGKALKGGAFKDHTYAEKLQDLLLFDSSIDGVGMRTFTDYVKSMRPGQEEIFYVTGDDRSKIERLPQMEIFKEKSVEVLYFTDKVDEFMIQNLREYQDKKITSILRGEVDLSFEESETESEEKDEVQDDGVDTASSDGKDSAGELLKIAKETLVQKVKCVRFSTRLRNSPVCLVSDSAGYSLNMERLYRDANHTMYRALKVLELNREHNTIKAMIEMSGKPERKDKLQSYIELLYSSALLIENEKIEDPVETTNLIAGLILDAS